MQCKKCVNNRCDGCWIKDVVEGKIKWYNLSEKEVLVARDAALQKCPYFECNHP